MNWLKTTAQNLWTNYHATITHAAAGLLALVVGVLAHRYGFDPRVVQPVINAIEGQSGPPAAQMTGPSEEPTFAMGWRDDPEEVARIKAGLPHPVFALTPAGQAADLPDHSYLWDASIAALGKHIPARNQLRVGSCTAHGEDCALEYLQVQTIVAALKAGQPPPQFRDLAQEVTYGLGRVQVGKGAIGDSLPPLYRNDGGTGAWMAQASRDYGVVARGVYGSYDLRTYSETTCRQFGNGQGCPASLIEVARLTPLKAFSPVTTLDELKAALASGYPVSVASNVGFGPTGGNVRDSNGFLRASGTWPHEMCFIGYQSSPEGYYCMNSWGPNWVSGPTGPGNPPPGGFWVRPADALRMLRANDSYAHSGFNGFPAQKLDWNVRVPVRAPALGRLLARGHLGLRLNNPIQEVALSW